MSNAYKESDTVFKVNLSDHKQVCTLHIKGGTCIKLLKVVTFLSVYFLSVDIYVEIRNRTECTC